MAIIVSTLRMLPAPGSRAEVLRALAAQLGPTRVQPGCLRCDLYQAVEDPEAIVLVEEWERGKDLERHLRSDWFRILRGACNLLREEPQMQFSVVSRTAPMRSIEL